MTSSNQAASDRALVLTRTYDAPRELVYRALTEPDMLKQWFVPKPWTISHAEADVRPGGTSLIVMRDPDGNEYPNRGVYLEAVKNEKIVVTDAYIKAWEPSDKPFMTLVVTLESLDGGKKTKYTATAMHWTVTDKEAHEKMGFHEGWGTCADQLGELLKTM